jgi:hypothetical protein
MHCAPFQKIQGAQCIPCVENTPAKIHAVFYGKYTNWVYFVFPPKPLTNTPNWCISRGLALAVQGHEREHIECPFTPPRGSSCIGCACHLLHWALLQLPGLGVLKGAGLRVWWSGIHHAAVEPLDVARSKDLTNTPNWCILVYLFGCISRGLGALHVIRAVVVLCRRSHVVWGSAASTAPTPVQSRARPRSAPAPVCHLGAGRHCRPFFGQTASHFAQDSGLWVSDVACVSDRSALS